MKKKAKKGVPQDPVKDPQTASDLLDNLQPKDTADDVEADRLACMDALISHALMKEHPLAARHAILHAKTYDNSLTPEENLELAAIAADIEETATQILEQFIREVTEGKRQTIWHPLNGEHRWYPHDLFAKLSKLKATP